LLGDFSDNHLAKDADYCRQGNGERELVAYSFHVVVRIRLSPMDTARGTEMLPAVDAMDMNDPSTVAPAFVV
jgi:hypothetical protein